MTTLVVLANGYGTVLCADSATTTGSRRVDNGAHKIIGLPKPHRVGVMHAGTVFFQGLPAETHVHNWAKTLPPQPLDNMTDYAESFTTYLERVPYTYRDEHDVAAEFLDNLASMLYGVRNTLQGEGALNDVGARAFFESEGKKLSEAWTTENQQESDFFFERLTLAAPRTSLKSMCEIRECNDVDHLTIESTIRRVFGENLSKDVLDVVAWWLRIYVAKGYVNDSPSISVFVGYGADDVLPRVQKVEIYDFLDHRLFCAPDNRVRPSAVGEGYALIQTFGQNNEIERLFQEGGKDVSYENATIDERFQELSGTADAASGVLLPSPTDIDSLRTAIQADIEETRVANYEEVYLSIGGLNLHSLISVGQRLVGLQSLILDLRSEAPTVGGVITTAVITAHGGFTMQPANEESEAWWD